MVSKTAIFVVCDDHNHLFPLRTLLQMRNYIGDVCIAGLHIRVSGCWFKFPCGL
jgi:hypothetical protein